MASDGTPTVSVFEWGAKKRRKVLGGIEGRCPVVALSFTQDGEYLLVQTGNPDWTLYYILWNKGSMGRVEATLRGVTAPGKPVLQVDTAPDDRTLLCATGNGVAKLYRLQDESFRPLPVTLRRDPCAFAGHVWQSGGRLVVATSLGELLVFEGGDCKKTLDAPATGTKPITSLLAFSKGFLVGCHGGVLRVYERAEDPRNYYRCTREYTLAGADAPAAASPSAGGEGGAGGGAPPEPIPTGRAGAIVSLTLSSSEEDVAVGTGGGLAYSIRLPGADLVRPGESPFRPLVASVHAPPAQEVPGLDDDAASSAAAAGGPAVLGPLVADPRPAQSHGITGLDTCLRKPLFVTAGSDKTVRIWNYTGITQAERSVAGGDVDGGAGGPGGGSGTELAPALEVCHRFHDTPTCVALHPNGFHVVVGFESSVQLCAIMLDGLKVVKELPVRQAVQVRFSHGGAFFAVAAAAAVNVYATFTCAPVCVLRGHADRVLSIAWSRDDRNVVTVGKDGMVARWSVVVPNATSAGPSTGGGAGAGGAGNKDGGAGASSRPSSAALAQGPVSLVGRMTHSVDIRDLHPFAVAVGHGDSGKDVYVSGTVVKGLGATATHTPVLRHIDLTAPKTDAVKASAALAGCAAHSLGVALVNGTGSTGLGSTGHAPFAVIVGMGRRVPASASATAAAAAAAASAASAASAAAAASAATSAASPGKPPAGAASAASPAAATPAPAVENDPVGCVRVYRPTLGTEKDRDSGAGPFVDLVCHASPVTHVASTRDGRLLITGAADGSLAVWSVADPHAAARGGGGVAGSGRGAAGATTASAAGGAAGGASSSSSPTTGSEEPLGWSEEVCVTKKSLETVVKERAALELRAAEIALVNKYSEREKEQQNEARLADADAEYEAAIAEARDRVAGLRQAREDAEARFHDQVAALEAAQRAELEDLETLYAGKIKGELGRYDRLVAERDRMTAEAHTALSGLAGEQHAALAEVRGRYEAAIAEEVEAVELLLAERQTLGEEIKEMADAIERDVDGEVEDMRARFETKLKAESETTLKVRGENALMKRKFVNDNKVITDQKEEQAALGEKEKELQEAISALQKDVAGHKKEIKEREETIGDKESRIYELKKKNQELEKFKFVLNYKIQELKRQIMPKKKEIADMREQLKEMELELLQYHKSNAALDLMITELRLKRDGMSAEVAKLEGQVVEKEETLITIGRDLTAVKATAVDPNRLRTSMYHLYHKYIHGDAASLSLAMAKTVDVKPGSAASGSGAGAAAPLKLSQRLSEQGRAALPPGANLEDLQATLAVQRQHLEKGVDGAKRRIEKESSTFASDRARLLRENAALTQEINDLRRDVHYLQRQMDAANNSTAVAAAAASAAARGSAFLDGQSVLSSSSVLDGGSSIGTAGGLGGATSRQPTAQQQNTASAPAPMASTLPGARRTAAVLGVVGAAGKGGKGGALHAAAVAASPMRR